jgi:hypothetical protein
MCCESEGVQSGEEIERETVQRKREIAEQENGMCMHKDK